VCVCVCGGGARYGEACLCVVVLGVILFQIILLLALEYTVPCYMISVTVPVICYLYRFWLDRHCNHIGKHEMLHQ
jgi:hypothetical protein